MDFAKGLLGKYGWKEGDGLGKEKQGIKRPIKANLKFDQAGLGADPSKEFNNHWWERAFNDAAKNVKVEKQNNGDVNINLKDAQNSVEVTTKGYSIKKLKECDGTKYGNNFISEDLAFNSFEVTKYKTLTDEELFNACGGRTAHKGARHGLKLSGKLARLEQQEKELLAKMQTVERTVNKNVFRSTDEPCEASQKPFKLKGENRICDVPEKTKSKKRRKEKQHVEECEIQLPTESDSKKKRKEQQEHSEECEIQLSKKINSKKKKKEQQEDSEECEIQLPNKGKSKKKRKEQQEHSEECEIQLSKKNKSKKKKKDKQQNTETNK